MRDEHINSPRVCRVFGPRLAGVWMRPVPRGRRGGGGWRVVSVWIVFASLPYCPAAAGCEGMRVRRGEAFVPPCHPAHRATAVLRLHMMTDGE